MSTIIHNLVFSSDDNAIFSFDGNVTQNWTINVPVPRGLDLLKTYSFYCEKVEVTGVGGFSDSSVILSGLLGERVFTFRREVMENVGLVIEPMVQELSDGGQYVYAYRVRLEFVWRQAGKPFSDERLLLMSFPKRMDVRVYFRGGQYMDILQATMVSSYQAFQPQMRIMFNAVFVYDERSGRVVYVNPSRADFLRKRNPAQAIMEGELQSLEMVGEKRVWYEHWRPSMRVFVDSEGVYHSRETARRMVLRGEFGSVLDEGEVLNMRVKRWFLEWLYADDRDRWIRVWDFQGVGNRGFVNVVVREVEYVTVLSLVKSVRLEVVERVPRGTLPISSGSWATGNYQSEMIL